MKVTT